MSSVQTKNLTKVRFNIKIVSERTLQKNTLKKMLLACGGGGLAELIQ